MTERTSTYTAAEIATFEVIRDEARARGDWATFQRFAAILGTVEGAALIRAARS